MPRAKQPNPANQRTDLLTPSAPGRAMEAPGQAYGRVTAQAQSQKILPVGPQPVASAPAGPTPALPPAAPSGTPAPAGAPPLSGPHAGGAPWLEPGQVSSGAPLSPAHEVMANQMAAQMQAQAATGEQGSLQSVLSHLASQPNASSITRALAATSGR